MFSIPTETFTTYSFPPEKNGPDEALTLLLFTQGPRGVVRGDREGPGHRIKGRGRERADRFMVQSTLVCPVCVLCAWGVLRTCELFVGWGWSGCGFLSMACACAVSVRHVLCCVACVRSVCRLCMHLWWG